LNASVGPASRLLWHRFFPPRVELPEEARRILAAVYPTLDLDRVTFHRGVPLVLDLAVFPGAIVIPAGMRRGKVYIQPRAWRPDSPAGLSLLVHEAFHALQLQEGGPGLGLIRPFTILYLACSAGSGFRYFGHPMERDAYAVAGLSRSRFDTLMRDGPGGVEGRLERLAGLAVRSSGLRFWPKLAGSTPGFRTLWRSAAGLARRIPVLGPLLAFLPAALAATLVLLWLTFWTAATAVLTAFRWLVEGTAAFASGVLWAGEALGRLTRGDYRW
jgi:hypothetical protein